MSAEGSWQEGLKRYMDLQDQIEHLESLEAKCCDCCEFYRCQLHGDIEELCIESNRLKDLWGNTWACKLWRIAHEGEVVTHISDKESTHA